MNFELTNAAPFLTEHRNKSVHSVEEIALLCGSNDPVQIAEILEGRRKLPLGLVAAMAVAVNCSETHLMTLALLDWLDEGVFELIERCFGPNVGSNNEAAWLEAIRDLHNGHVPELTAGRRRRLKLLAQFSA